MSKVQSPPLTLICPDPTIHADEIYDLTGKVFSGGNEYYGWQKYCREYYFGNSHFDWSASTIGLMDGHIVTHWGVWNYAMRIGTARVKCGGIGAVATDGRYRSRGLMTFTGNENMAQMRRCGYDLSVLFGKHDFYHRYGYVRSWPGRHWSIGVSELPAEKPHAAPVLLEDPPRDAFDRLYNRYHAGLTGTAVRPTFRGPMLQWGHKHFAWPVRGRGAPTLDGYIICSFGGQDVNVAEFAGDTEQVLRALRLLADQNGCKKINFMCLHHDSDLCRRIRRVSCNCSTTYTRNGGEMVAMVNLESTMSKLTGELSRRLKHSELAAWRGELLIEDQTGKVLLKIDRGRVGLAKPAACRNAIRGGMHVVQLVVGTQDPFETIDAAGIKLTGEANRLLPVLFPDQHPMLSQRDHF
ncbi:MAG: GNAT family N-acetyltransferase [Planctomycetaceae bacterium]|nr:GNAT family N-acetyltransferase [Planctomycetaceae bacterium]